MNALFNLEEIKVNIDKIENEITKEKNITLSILRLDKIHTDIAGNKFFKLRYFLEEAIAAQKKIITFGGAYSNHLAATASACKALQIECIGIVRGDESKDLSHTLFFCREKGMQLKFISRENYKIKNTDNYKLNLKDDFGDHILIPEGGFTQKGMKGASLISTLYDRNTYSHICCAVGTATTLAGLINGSSPSQKIIGFSALKNLEDFEQRINFLLTNSLYENYFLNTDYHFEGFAKKTAGLINFMNSFYKEFAIPTDFIYTAKMMFGIFDLIKKNYFYKGSKILGIHTGGLQGNLSLPAGSLIF